MAESDTPPPQDPFETFRRLWGPLGLPVPGMAMPTMDPREVEKRVADLKSVEAWLAMNLNMLRAAIQGLEMQKSGLQQMQGMQQAMQQAMAAMNPPEAKDRKPQEGTKPQDDRKP